MSEGTGFSQGCPSNVYRHRSSLNVCVSYIVLFWIAIWPLCEEVTSVWLSASDVSIRVQLFRVCVSFPLMSLMGVVG